MNDSSLNNTLSWRDASLSTMDYSMEGMHHALLYCRDASLHTLRYSRRSHDVAVVVSFHCLGEVLAV